MTSSPPTTVANATAVAIEPKLVTNVPAGYVLQPDSLGDTGPSDLAKAARDDGSADAEQVLTAAGFLGGYQRLWSTADGTSQIIVFVYQFRTAAGAQSYDEHGLAALRATQGLTGFDVAGVPGAVGLQGTAQGTSAAIVDAAKGEWLFQIIGNIDGDDVPAAVVADVRQLAKDQYDRL